MMIDKTKEPKCTLANEELIEKCKEWISSLCKTGGQSWTLRVPVDFNRDPDMLFNELINRFKATQQPAMTEEQMEQEAREITIPDNVDPKLIEDLAQQISRSCPSQDFKLIQPSNEIVAATIVRHKGKGKALKMWCRISFQTMGLVTLD